MGLFMTGEIVDREKYGGVFKKNRHIIPVINIPATDLSGFLAGLMIIIDKIPHFLLFGTNSL